MCSNTYWFYKKGWNGMNIDANPSSIKSFNFDKHSPDYFLIEDLNYSRENIDFMGFISSPLYRFMDEHNYIVVAKTKLTVLFKK
jgi:hypothetical protein